jgi:glycerol uptake facilitator-like aquaporin
VFAIRGEVAPRDVAGYLTAQIAGGILGVLVAHGMFEENILQISTKVRAGPAQWLSEAVAAFGLMLTILLTLRANPAAVATSVGLFITAAYWFTASTSFANPAVTIARALSDTFAGIRPADVVPFIVAQFAGAVAAAFASRWLLASRAGT